MKLARIARQSIDGAVARLVAVQPERQQVIDLVTVARRQLEQQGATSEAALRLATTLFPASMADAIALGDVFLRSVRQTLEYATEEAAIPFSSVQWLPPLDPPLIRDFLAFGQHARNAAARMGQSLNEMLLKLPVYYKGNPQTLIGHEQEVPWPNYTNYMDYELELGLVIGKSGRNLTPQAAMSHLFGVTIYNDFSARDIQGQEMRGMLGPAKGKDFATALGPWITTRDELNVEQLTMIARVNGEEWSHNSSATINWKVGEIIAYASKGELLQPGELIGTGTVGLGCGLELGKKLEPGDVVELEVEGIGTLRNRLGQPEARGWEPELRQSFG